MFDLSKPWPLGIDRRNWWRFALAAVAVLGAVFWFDRMISVWAQAWPAPVVGFFAFITDYGLSDWILLPALVLMVVSGALVLAIRQTVPRLALLQMTQLYAFIFVGVGLPGLVSNLIKRSIGRGRPEVFDQAGTLGLHNFFNDFAYQSFPSGHTTTAFAFAFVVGFMSKRWFPLALLAAVAVGVSRVAVGAHYPTDVLGGVMVGTLGAYAVRGFFASRGWLFRRQPDGHIEMRPFAAVQRLVRNRKTQAR